MKSEELGQLMAEASTKDERILACVKTPENAYAIRFEDSDVLVEWDEARGRLVLSAEISSPTPSRAAHIHETLLSYNLLWRDTGGVHMALSGRSGAVIQFADLAGTEIAARQIAIVAVNLAERTGIWRAYLESEGGDVDVPRVASASASIRA